MGGWVAAAVAAMSMLQALEFDTVLVVHQMHITEHVQLKMRNSWFFNIYLSTEYSPQQLLGSSLWHSLAKYSLGQQAK